MKQKQLILVILIALPTFSLFGITREPLARFLSLPPSAKYMGMGETGSMINGSEDLVSVNPATLSNIKGLAAFVSFSQFANSFDYLNAFAAFKTPIGSFGFGITNVNYGNLEVTSVNSAGQAYVTGNSIDLNSKSMMGTYAIELAGVSIGSSIRYVQEERLQPPLRQLSFDGGVQKAFLNSKLLTGLSLTNYSVARKSNDAQATLEYLPTTLDLGLGFKMVDVRNHRITITTEIKSLLYDNFTLDAKNAGIEYTLYKLVSLRGGFISSQTENNFTSGIGFNINSNQLNMTIDYALKTNREFGLQHHTTLHIKYLYKSTSNKTQETK